MAALSDHDRQETVQRYLDRFEQFGVDLRTLNIGDPEKYARQHAIHASIGPLEGATVLDVGCGLANFYQGLTRRGIAVNYIGYDITDAFTQANRQRFPEARFRT